MKKTIFTFLFFASSLSFSQSREIIYTSDRKGQVKLTVPTENSESPSVVITDNYMALGPAARIMAEKQSLKTQNQVQKKISTDLEVVKIPLWTKNSYVGYLSQISPNILIGSAHTVGKLDKKELQKSISAIATSDYAFIYQLYQNQKPIDVVLISSLSIEELKLELDLLVIDNEFLVSGNQFFTSHLVQMDSRLVEQENSGLISVSQDKNTIYLPTSIDSFLTWGSSGSVVFVNSSQKIGIGGIVQCHVSNNNRSIGGTQFFRAISSKVIKESSIILRTLEEVANSISSFDLKNCDPVGGKDGGG